MSIKLTGVMIGSEDPKKLSEFYTRIFGKPGWDDANFTGYDIDGGFLMIGPHSEVKGQSETPARIMVTLVTTEVQAEFDRMKAEGAKVVAEPYQPSKENESIWLATVADPDGNYLQLATPWDM